MARKPRISYPGALHHIIVRGNHKEEIFLHDRDRQRFIELLKEYHERYLFKCYAYTLMPNHIHLLIEEGDIPLSKIMQGINQSYTQYFNTKYEKAGHLFQGRYKTILCDKDRYLIILVRYIHLNPVRALLVKRPEQYKWSSHNAYLYGGKESFIETEFVLSLFSSQKKQAIKRYKSFIHDAMEKKIESHLETGLILGDEEFAEKHRSKQAYPRMKNETALTLGQISSFVAHHFNISEQLLHTKSREKKLFEIRGLVGFLASKYTNTDQKEIAKYFNRTASTMCHAIKNSSRSIKEDPAFRCLVEQLIKKLFSS
jgi:putative transposase